MIKSILLTTIAFLLLLTPLMAQVEPGEEGAVNDQGPGNRGELLRRELGLTPQQMMQIRTINRDTRPKMRIAQEKLRLARQDLNQAIYDDSFDEEVLRIRLHNVVEAQAEVTKLQALSEVAVRKVLSPEQLGKFRVIRERFSRRQEGPARRMGDGMRNRRNRPRNPVTDRPPPPPQR